MPTKTSLWLTRTALLAHRCWRMLPKLSRGLTEILVGGSYRGVSVDAAIFCEPGQPLAARGRTTTETRAMVAAERDKRFACTLQSLEILIQWTKTEPRSF